MNVDIFIQARLGSTRLPGKVLKIIGNFPNLVLTYRRIRQTKNVREVVVITSENHIDDQIVDVCIKYKIPFFRGSEHDCLDRHYQAAKKFNSDLIFKIPSDCPLSDPKTNEEVISILLNNYSTIDYVSNYHPPTFPDGLDIEGCKFSTLEDAWQNAEKKIEREHTFPYIWDNPQRYSIANVVNKKGNMFLTHRWTLDYIEDFEFINRVYSEFLYDESFTFSDILDLLDRKPGLTKINHMYNGVNWYRNHMNDLKTISSDQFKKYEK